MSKPEPSAQVHNFPNSFTTEAEPHRTVHVFPPDFPPDTEYLHAALAEWNYRERTSRGVPSLRYDALPPAAVMQVLGRAQEMKQAAREARGQE